MSRFVKPETRVLTISGGDTLVVKRRLNMGEEAELFARWRDEQGRVDRARMALCTVQAYLMDWSFKDDDGAPVPYRELSYGDREQTLKGLDPDDFIEIRLAIEKHTEDVAAERVAKKQSGGETASSATSPSPESTAGGTSGSTNSTPTSTPLLSKS